MYAWRPPVLVPARGQVPMIPGVSTIVFLLILGIVLPVLAVASDRRLAAGARLPPRRALYVQAILLQGGLCALALHTARAREIALFAPPGLTPAGVMAGGGLLALALGTLPARWTYQSEMRRRRLYGLVPRTGGERGLWVLVCLCAGVCEEIVYRGVLFTTLEQVSHSRWAAALGAALVFGLAHMIQGWKSAATVVLFALGFQGVVLLSGDLYVAMAVHFLYDLVAGVACGILGRTMEPEPATIEPDPSHF